MSRGAKSILWIVILAVVVLVFVWQGRQRLRKDEVLSIEAVQEAEGIPVDVVTARTRVLENWRRFTGEAEGLEQVDLVSDFRTKVVEVHGELGEDVGEDALIVSLDPSDPARIMMNRDSARAQYENARADSARIEALFAEGAVSQQQLEQTRTMTTAARVAWEGASKAVDLRTPIAGLITSLSAEVDRYVESGAVVATIASLDRMRVRVALSDRERGEVREGQPARIRLSDGTELGGKVFRLPLSANSETRLYDAELVFENPGHRLRPGMLVTVEVLVATDSDLPLMPASALIRRDGKLYCYVVENDRAVLREITPGIQDERLLAVASGLAENEKVVVAGRSKLVDGVKVSIKSELSDSYFGEH